MSPAARREPKGADQLRSLTAGFAPPPEPEARPARRRPGQVTPADSVMPVEVKPEPLYGGKGAAVHLTLPAGVKRALDLARLDDGIETNARIRALVDLYLEDERLAKRVDKRALGLLGRGRTR